MRRPALPAAIPLFPLPGALVFPRGLLPLNIFEPRYLALVRDAMAGNRMIGMVQPREEDEQDGAPPLYSIGALGRITRFEETDDGRFMIALTGVTRFRIVKELAVETPYRQAEVDYVGFADHDDPVPLAPALRAALEDEMRNYLDRQGLAADWEAVESSDDEALVNTLAAVCPFATSEKQALLEAADLGQRASMLAQLMRFAIDDGDMPTTLQ